jgi:hypothetical protein
MERKKPDPETDLLLSGVLIFLAGVFFAVVTFAMLYQGKAGRGRPLLLARTTLLPSGPKWRWAASAQLSGFGSALVESNDPNFFKGQLKGPGAIKGSGN